MNICFSSSQEPKKVIGFCRFTVPFPITSLSATATTWPDLAEKTDQSRAWIEARTKTAPPPLNWPPTSEGAVVQRRKPDKPACWVIELNALGSRKVSCKKTTSAANWRLQTNFTKLQVESRDPLFKVRPRHELGPGLGSTSPSATKFFCQELSIEKSGSWEVEELLFEQKKDETTRLPVRDPGGQKLYTWPVSWRT